MKANELMVKDWVSYCGFYNKVIYIGQKVSMYNGKGTEFTTDSEYIRPIPLTEEILVKNGFQKLNDKTFLLKNQIEIEVGPKFSEVSARYEAHDRMWDSYSNRYIEIAIIHYVHELQHLLRLMGVEKEIEL